MEKQSKQIKVNRTTHLLAQIYAVAHAMTLQSVFETAFHKLFKALPELDQQKMSSIVTKTHEDE